MVYWVLQFRDVRVLIWKGRFMNEFNPCRRSFVAKARAELLKHGRGHLCTTWQVPWARAAFF